VEANLTDSTTSVARQDLDDLRNARAEIERLNRMCDNYLSLCSEKDQTIERLRDALDTIECVARGEGDIGNLVARRAAAALRPESTAP
jgi:hypothetical protein